MSATQAKILHVVGLIAAMIMITGPSLATGFNVIGMPAWAHAVSAIVGLLSIPIIRQMIPIQTTSSLASMKAAVLKATTAAIQFAAFALLCASLGGVAVSCAAFSKSVPLLEPAGACIVTQLLDGGATDPLQIVAACAGTTIDDVIAVVEALTAAQPPSDGGAPTPTQLRLAAIHVRALGIRAAK